MKIGKKKIDITNLVIHILFCCLTVLMVYPFISMLSVSLTGEEELIYYGYRVWPEHPNLDAYKVVLRGFKPVLNALLTSLFVCVTGTLMCVFVNSTFAYTVSRRSFPAARIVNFLLLFTMFVGGGTAASYIVNINWLKLKNNLLILIVPGSIGTMNVIIIRSFFQSLPYGLIESAKLDGASEFQVYWKIMFPLSTPALGTIAISTFIGKWNDYYGPMMYFDTGKATTLALYLQRTTAIIEMAKSNSNLPADFLSNVPGTSIAMATACITILPMVFVFPYFQKYFVKGMAIGAIKA